MLALVTTTQGIGQSMQGSSSYYANINSYNDDDDDGDNNGGTNDNDLDDIRDDFWDLEADCCRRHTFGYLNPPLGVVICCEGTPIICVYEEAIEKQVKKVVGNDTLDEVIQAVIECVWEHEEVHYHNHVDWTNPCDDNDQLNSDPDYQDNHECAECEAYSVEIDCLETKRDNVCDGNPTCIQQFNEYIQDQKNRLKFYCCLCFEDQPDCDLFS